MNRRDFIRTAGTGAAGLALLGLPDFADAAPRQVKLTILHTNDMHSRIEPFPSGSNAGMGGMARRASLISQIRQQEQNVLLLDSGDIFQGTPYFNFYGGELEFKLMSRMGYDAATLGNHDFDNGMDGLLRQLPHAQFPFLCANYDFSNTPLAGRFQPYKVFEKQGIRIGVFGLGIELAGLVSDRHFGNTRYLDPVTVARQMVTQLRTVENCQLVVCLSHLGYQYPTDKISDQRLAQLVTGIDVILGGHTHTLLEKPDEITSSGHTTLINQTGWAGMHLGRLDFVFTRGKAKQLAGSALLPVVEEERIRS